MRKLLLTTGLLILTALALLAAEVSAQSIHAADEGCSEIILPCVDGVDYTVFVGSKLTINPDYDGPGQTNPSEYDFWRCQTTDYVGTLTPEQCTLIGNAANGYIVKESDLGLQIIATRGCKPGSFEIENYVPYGPSICIRDRAEKIPNSPIAPTMPVVKQIWAYLPVTFSVPAAYRPNGSEFGDDYSQEIYYYMIIGGKIRTSCKDKVRDQGVFLACPPFNSNFYPLKKDNGKKAIIQACSEGREVDDGPNPYFLESRHCVSTKPIKIGKTKTYGGGGFVPPSGWRPIKDPGATLYLTGSKTAEAEMDYAGINVALISNRAGQATVTVKIPAKEARAYSLPRQDIPVGSFTVTLSANADPLVTHVKVPSTLSKKIRKAIKRQKRYAPDAVPVQVSVSLN